MINLDQGIPDEDVELAEDGDQMLEIEWMIFSHWVCWTNLEKSITYCYFQMLQFSIISRMSHFEDKKREMQ